MCRNLQKSRSNLSHKTLGRLKQQKIYGGIVMAGAREYIIEFGNTSFEEYPFCDADALVLCQIFYMPLERVVSSSFDKAPLALADAANELFNMMGGKYRRLGLMIPKDASKNIMLMAARRRYADVKIQAVEEVFSINPPFSMRQAHLFCPTAQPLLFSEAPMTLCPAGRRTLIYSSKRELRPTVTLGSMLKNSLKLTRAALCCAVTQRAAI